MQPDISVPKPTNEFHKAYEAIFGKKKEKQEESLPPLDLPPAKIQDDFGAIHEEPALDLLDMPPKKPEPLPPLEDWSLAEAEKDLEEIAPDKKGKQKQVKNKEQKTKVHDFLSEIKFGNGNVQETFSSPVDTSFEEKELAFEKETMKDGAKDLEQAFKRKTKQNIMTSSAEAKKYKKGIVALKKREDTVVQKEKTAQQKLDEVKDIEHRLQIEEDSIIKKIKQLQADEKLLEKEQDSLLASVRKFEREKQDVEHKQRKFQTIVNEISDAEAALKQKSKDIDRREEQVRRKEKIVQEEVAKLQKLKKTAEKLKDVEETYKNVRERLRKAYQEYEEKFTPSTPALIRPVQFQTSLSPKMSSFDEGGDISNLILATKQMILSKHYDDANKNITRLMNRYMQIPDTHPRKKEIYYEILSLKNMIKLDLLE